MEPQAMGPRHRAPSCRLKGPLGAGIYPSPAMTRRVIVLHSNLWMRLCSDVEHRLMRNSMATRLICGKGVPRSLPEVVQVAWQPRWCRTGTTPGPGLLPALPLTGYQRAVTRCVLVRPATGAAAAGCRGRVLLVTHKRPRRWRGGRPVREPPAGTAARAGLAKGAKA